MFLRLYWYPTKALYALHVAVYYYPGGAPYILSFSFLLWVLFFMHIYWFIFIINLVHRLIVGKEINDNRDYYDDDDEDSKRPDGIDKSEE